MSSFVVAVLAESESCLQRIKTLCTLKGLNFRFITQKEEEQLPKADFVVAEPSFIVEHFAQFKNAKLIQSAFAGVDKIFSSPIDRSILKDVPLCRLVDVFGPIMGEYVLGQIIANERGFFQMWEAQKSKKWIDSEVSEYRLLSDLNVGLLGFGSIGSVIGKMLKFHGCNVHGFVRDLQKHQASSEPGVTLHNLSDFDSILPKCDYIVNVLPCTPHTVHLLDQYSASLWKKGSVFINIGRGSIISEPHLLSLLGPAESATAGSYPLSRAILDVFAAEPLTATSSLWTHPRTVITPHVSGVTPSLELAKQFWSNAEHVLEGKVEELVGCVDWERGY